MAQQRTLRRLRNRSPYRARSARQGGQWTPANLAPFAWYDAQIGGSSTQITDSSGNGRAAATFATGSNSPLHLAYTGTPYVALPGLAPNVISCTAPASATSFSAAPLGGGAPTTGAATGGAAFSFQDAGNWLSVSLLNAGAVEVARFSAASSTQTGHTDSYGVVWTVGRSTSGRKTVVLSPAANSARSVVLFGSDDYLNVPTAAAPPRTSTDTYTVVAVARVFATPTSGGRIVDLATLPGAAIRGVTTLVNPAPNQVQTFLGAGTTQVGTATATFTAGQRLVVTVGITPTALRQTVNNTAGADANIAAITNRDPAAAGAIGVRTTGLVQFIDMEFEALLTLSRALTTGEIAQLVAFYRGGL